VLACLRPAVDSYPAAGRASNAARAAERNRAMELTNTEAEKVVSGCHADWTEVNGSRGLIDHDSWTVVYKAAFLHKPTGKHYSFWWVCGLTEQQEQTPYESNDPDPIEVELKEVTKMEWVPVGEKG